MTPDAIESNIDQINPSAQNPAPSESNLVNMTQPDFARTNPTRNQPTNQGLNDQLHRLNIERADIAIDEPYSQHRPDQRLNTNAPQPTDFSKVVSPESDHFVSFNNQLADAINQLKESVAESTAKIPADPSSPHSPWTAPAPAPDSISASMNQAILTEVQKTNTLLSQMKSRSGWE